jgi:glycosyltransferase involved in cell wall biosynthesis
MRIGVDGACLANGRGYGRFTRELLAHLLVTAPEYQFTVYADQQTTERAQLEAPNLRVVDVAQSVSPARAAAADGYRSPADMLRFTRAVWRDRPDVFWSPSVYTYFPLPPRQCALITIHDTITERFPELTMPSQRARVFWRAKVSLALWQATLILTVSEFAAKEIETILGVPRARLRVAGEAAASTFSPSAPDQIVAAAKRAGIPDGVPWFTYVGGFTPHKHVDVIVRAHAALAREASENARPVPRLLLVGTMSADNFHGVGAGIREAITECGTGPYVLWPGYVPDEELRHLLSGTQALLIPSENEGFGLPAVEAAACGAPVVATTASPLPELLAGGGFFVAPRDLAALTNAMRALLDPRTREHCARVALDCASRLTWRASALATLSALRDTVALRSGLRPVPAAI